MNERTAPASAGDAQDPRTRHLEHEVRAAARALIQQQTALARAQRLAAIGELAASLAHDLRNPLAAVQAAIGNLRGELGDAEQRERLDMVLAELKRMATRLNQLLDAARQPPEPTRELVLADTIETLVALTHYRLPDAIRVENRVAPGLRWRLPEGGLRHAVLNLLINAANAIGEAPGTITIEAAERDGRLALAVSDDGPGFSPEALETGSRAFASWYPGGTGLGLATVKRFARDLGGDLLVENRAEGGARVTLLLPGAHGDG